MGIQEVNWLKAAFHFIAVLYHFYVIYCLHTIDFSTSTHKYVTNMVRFSSRYFTTWNFSIQSYYFTLCVIDDLLQLAASDALIGIKAYIKKIKHYTFRTFVFPLSFTVAIMFWSMFTLDRYLIYPPEMDKVMPGWINHAMHTNIVVIVLMELATTFHWYPRARNQAVIGLTIFTAVYTVCYLSTYIFHGVWLYPVHDVMNWTQRAVLSMFTYGITVGFYFFGEGLSAKIWGSTKIPLYTERKSTLHCELSQYLHCPIDNYPIDKTD